MFVCGVSESMCGVNKCGCVVGESVWLQVCVSDWVIVSECVVVSDCVIMSVAHP